MSIDAHAVLFTEPGRVSYQPVTCPDPGPGQVVIRVTHSWISNGTEGSYLRGERIAGDTARRDGDPWPFPIVAGYQKVGLVEWVGEAVDDLAVGDVVFAIMGAVDGMFEPRGGHVSPTVTDRGQVWKLPPHLDPVAFSGLVLTQVGYNCGIRPPVGIGDATVVLGDGLVGQWAAQTLAWRGARVAMVGRHADRLRRFAGEPGSRHGCTAIDATGTDWLEETRGLFPEGIGLFVDTVGSIADVERVQPAMVRYGHIVSAGFYGTRDQLPLQPPRSGELSIHLVSGIAPDRLTCTLDLVAAGHLQTLPLITHHFPVEEAAAAWQLIESKSEPVLGVVLDW